MSGRRWTGLALMLGGVLVLGYGASRLLTAGGTSVASPTATASAATSASASGESASPPPSVAPTPTPVPTLGEADVRAFVEVLVTAIHDGDVDTMVANLHPAVKDRYGQDACRTAVAGFTDPTFEIEVLEVQEQAAWDYLTDGVTTTIPDAWAVPGNRSAGGQTIAFTFHFAPFGDAVRWFTDCGTPL